MTSATVSVGDSGVTSARARHPSDSSEQRDAEVSLRDALAVALGIPLATRRVLLDSGRNLQIDAAGEGVLCEIFAHCGSLRAGQIRKVMDDAARLRFGARSAGQPTRLILAFCDERAARPFRSGWRGEALKADGIEVLVVEVDASVRERILAAQRRQFR